MSIPAELKYTASHEWVRVEADGSITVGITEHAQELLGDMVYVEAPTVGRSFVAAEECAVVESVKAAADVYAPVAGTITAANGDLDSAPELLNSAPYDNWIFKMQPAAGLDNLLDAAGYQAVIDSEDH